MKKYAKCSSCGREDLFEEEDKEMICRSCISLLITDIQNGLRRGHVSRYEDFLKGDNPYISTPCHNRLPNGNFCDLIPGKARQISPIACLNCHDRITGNTLQECIEEDEDAIE